MPKIAPFGRTAANVSQVLHEASRWPDENRPATELLGFTPEQHQAEVNRINAALFNAKKPAMSVRPKFDLKAAEEALADALVKRSAALNAFSAQVQLLDRAKAATIAATRAVDEHADVQGEVATHYASLIATNKPLELTPALTERVRNKRIAIERREDLQAAQLQLHQATEPFRVALAQAEHDMTSAALLALRCHGEAVAEKCHELHQAFLECRTELATIAAVHVNTKRLTTQQMSPLWLDELAAIAEPEAKAIPSGMAAWNQRVRNWLAGRA
jgi:hypothetical protein